MKHRSSYKFIIIFALVFVLSIGYAVVNSVTLTVSGSASAMTTALKTEFTGRKYISNTSKASATFVDSQNIRVNVSDLELNETIEIEFEVINNEQDLSVQFAVTDVTPTNLIDEFFDIQVFFGKGLTGTSNVYEDIYPFIAKPGEKVTGKLMIKLIKTPIKEEDSEIEFLIKTVASPYRD